nr:hypothetical protein [Tanacetum cinerariifolium]
SPEEVEVLTKARILVVDDSQVALQQSVITLRNLGIECHTARSAREAIDHLLDLQGTAQQINVVVSDIEMSEMDGYAFTRTLRETPDFQELRPHSRSPRDLRPGPTDASTGHYWLMRRDLTLPRRPVAWPETLHEVPFSAENAAAVHRLLALGTQHGGGRVADFTTWLNGFESDPEFDPALCFVVEDPLGVVAVAQCWTSA